MAVPLTSTTVVVVGVALPVLEETHTPRARNIMAETAALVLRAPLRDLFPTTAVGGLVAAGVALGAQVRFFFPPPSLYLYGCLSIYVSLSISLSLSLSLFLSLSLCLS